MFKINPSIAILFLGYNDKGNLPEAIASVQKQTYPDFDIFYLDNGSSDGSATFVEKNFPSVKVIRERNLGYAGTYAKHLLNIFSQKYTAAILLNTDIVVAEDWLENLALPALEDNSVATAQPKIYLWEKEKTNKINTFGNPIHFLGIGYCSQSGQEDAGQLNQQTELAYASGCCLLIKKTAFEKIGNLDKDFFMYLEDQDFGIRARLLNWKNILCINSKMWHKYQFQKNPKNKQKFFYLERNRLFFIWKNYSTKLLLLLFPAFLLLEIGILIHATKNCYFKEKILANITFLRVFRKTQSKRRSIQKNRLLSDQDFFSLLSPTLEIENMGGKALKFVNLFFQWYYALIKKLL